MYTLVCQRMPNIEGCMDLRPLAIFSTWEDARRFLRILVANQIYATVKNV